MLASHTPTRTVEPPVDAELVPFGVLAPPSQRNDWRGWWDGPRVPRPGPAAPPAPAVEQHQALVDVPEPRPQTRQPTRGRRGPQKRRNPVLPA